MPISKEQAKNLYGTDCAPPVQNMRKISNIGLLWGLSKQPLRMVAETFLRPRMAMKYQLLPALGCVLASARPSRLETHGLSKEVALLRSVALLLETADPSWKELPKTWTYLGIYFDAKRNATVDYAAAQEELANIFATTPIERPMRLLENFCAPFPDEAEWKRYFRLSDEEFEDFKAEKQQTIDMIEAPDEEAPPQA